MTEVTCEQGVDSASVTRIVRRARVSRRTFYELFEDRGECFAAVFEEGLARISARVAPIYQAEGRWVDRMRAALSALLRIMDEEPELARVCVVHALAAGPPMLARRARIMHELARAIDEGRREQRVNSKPPPPLTAEGLVGAVFSVIHARLVEPGPVCLDDLAGSLMSVIVLPYLGSAAAERELAKSAIPGPVAKQRSQQTAPHGPLDDLGMRITYRTLRVLAVIAEAPEVSNRQIADRAGIADQGQTSRLLTRLEGLGLVANTGEGPVKGAANAWTLTPRGREVHHAMQPQS